MKIISMVFRIVVIVAVMTGFVFLPFIRGDYDGSSVAISSIVTLMEFGSLLLLPVGIASIALKRPFTKPITVICSLVVLVASVGGFANNQLSLTLVVLVTWIIALPVLMKREVLPIYLISIPLLLNGVRFMYIDQAAESSRGHAIAQSVELINDIEAYRAKNNKYPVSLLSLWEDYKPDVRGIQRYNYELNGEAYNLYFVQFMGFSEKSVIMYNKLDEHEMNSHNQDRLRLSEQEQDSQRGYLQVQDLEQPHWKVFRFD